MNNRYLSPIFRFTRLTVAPSPWVNNTQPRAKAPFHKCAVYLITAVNRTQAIYQ